jgi:hypothetical protein
MDNVIKLDNTVNILLARNDRITQKICREYDVTQKAYAGNEGQVAEINCPT